MLRSFVIVLVVLGLFASPAMAKRPRQPATPLPAPKAPSAYDAHDDIFYHFMPIAWRYGEPKGDLPHTAREHRFGNFAGMSDSLPYLKSLGVTGVWINPIFPSPAYHGYQHGPADTVNPWFGSEREFLDFLAAAKSHDIKVYLDLVTYGISQDSIYFKDAKDNPASAYSRSLAFTNKANSKFTGYSFKTWNGDSVGFINWDLRPGPARDLVIAWSKKWLDPNADGIPSDGVAGYRLDHVWRHYDKGPQGWGYNIDDFWRAWRAELEKTNPALFTFAEQAKWETHGEDLLCTSDGANAHDAAFTKIFESAAREALKTETAKPLYDAMDATLKACPKGRTFLAIIGDHDVDRLATAIGADKPETAGRAKAAAAVLMLQPFPPVLYYGDEIGMLGKAGDFHSDANDIPRREPMKWNAADGPPMTNYWALHQGALAARYSKDHDGRSVEEQHGAKGSLLETYRELARLRRQYIGLRRGEYVPLRCEARSIWAFERRAGGQVVQVLINVSGKAADVAIDGLAPVSVPPYSHLVRVVRTEE